MNLASTLFAVFNACAAGAFAVSIGPAAAIGNTLLLCVVLVDAVCDTIKEKRDAN